MQAPDMSNKHYALLLGNVPQGFFSTFKDAWECANNAVKGMAAKGCTIKMMHDTYEACLAANPGGVGKNRFVREWDLTTYSSHPQTQRHAVLWVKAP